LMWIGVELDELKTVNGDNVMIVITLITLGTLVTLVI